MLPVDGSCVDFEWIGKEDYLAEAPKDQKRSRGANCTSADAIVSSRRTDNTKQSVLIEWKYTESYSGTSLVKASSGRDRRDIYRSLYEHDQCPIRTDRLPDFDSLFYEPFYQLMRQQFLAWKMEDAHELDADVVSVLHLSPKCNDSFRKVTSPKLVSLGQSPVEIWKQLTVNPNRFASVSVEDLFGPLQNDGLGGDRGWVEYIFERYSWAAGNKEEVRTAGCAG